MGVRYKIKKTTFSSRYLFGMAGPAGFEPTMTESKSVALPLGYGPNC